MLKVPDHQVAGHQAVDGKLGPLIDELGRFYKPLQSNDRGSQEVSFYEALRASASIPDHIRNFFPTYYGTKLVEASDGTGPQLHLVLQDLISSNLNASVMDLKIGCRTWPMQSSEDYVNKCLKKDRESTSLPLGFRISGFQIYEGKESGYWKPGRKTIKSFSVDDVRLALRKFVSANASADSTSTPDCSFASNVYGGSTGILAQLMKLKAWFEEQTVFHFFSCSILLIHDNGLVSEGRSSKKEVKLIDFAHVFEGNGVIDHNFLGGLCSLIKFISEILDGHNDCRIESGKKD